MSQFMSLEDIPAMGKGYRANQYIRKGALLLEESPLMTIPQLDILERDAAIEDEVARMLPIDRQLFSNLQIAYAYQSGNHTPAVGRFLTNALLCEAEDGFNFAGLFLLGARFNSSCTPNVHQFWNGRVMEFRAMTDILRTQELCISYNTRSLMCERTTRRAIIRRDSGYECQCVRCLEQSWGSDQRRLRIGLALDITDHGDHQFVVRNFSMIINALEDLRHEGLHHYRDTLLYDGYRVCVAAGDGNNAMLWLRKAYDAAVVVVGAHNPIVQRLGALLNTSIPAQIHFNNWVQLMPPPEYD